MVFKMALQDKELLKQSWAVSWPMSLIMFFIFLIGIADVYVAGLFGKEIQAAYGLASQIYFIFSIMVFGLTVGTVSVVSRLFTSDNKEEFNRAVDSSFLIAVVLGILFSLLGIGFSKGIIYSMPVPEVLKERAVSFMRVYSFALLFSYLLINTNGILRACKMVKKSLITMAVVCVLNICLNFILAFKTPLGFTGIAVSTLVSMSVGALLNFIFVRRLMGDVFSFSFSISKRLFAVGWPAAALQVVWQIASVVLYFILSALPQNRVEVLAAFTNGLKVESAIFLPAFAFNMASAVVVGNLLGARKRHDAFHAGILTALLGVIVVTVMTLVVITNARRISSFLSQNVLVVAESTRYIIISLLFEPVMAWGVILGGALNGAGDTRGVTKITALCLWFVRIPLSYLLGIHFRLGVAAIWWSMNVSILCQSIFISRRYFSRRWIDHEVAENYVDKP
ncbi:MAG: MATE family efflux transporter [Candidatus Omnitrophica bacterium]|nr:MATE family efflux transporter [Candidatus Omnitrophota bacterium]